MKLIDIEIGQMIKTMNSVNKKISIEESLDSRICIEIVLNYLFIKDYLGNMYEIN